MNSQKKGPPGRDACLSNGKQFALLRLMGICRLPLT